MRYIEAPAGSNSRNIKKALIPVISAITAVFVLVLVISEKPFCYADDIVSLAIGLDFTDQRSFVESLFGKITVKSEETPESPEFIDYGAKLSEIIGNEDITENTEMKIPDGCYPIVQKDISYQNGDGKVLFRNKTGKDINDKYIEKLLSAEYPIIAEKSASPLVLIVHTHTTEAFAKDGIYHYNPEKAVSETRSRDDGKNVIAVGDAFESVLNGMGIATVHCRDYHDIYVFSESYNHSYKTVSDYLNMYPSIRYVVDIHRDSVINTDGTKISPTAEIDGRPAAQVMILVGSDDKGLSHPKWEQNLTLAVKLQKRLVDKYPNLSRPVNIRGGRFNQQLSPGMLLLEIGSCGNTLAQAEYSARLVASEYGDMIKENMK